jgi:O-antigen/teichoic acid export membrane protein
MTSQLLKSTAVYGVADLAAKIIGFFAFPIYANILSLEQFGSLNLGSTISGVLGLFMSMGINNAVQRYYHEYSSLPEGRASVVTNGFLTVFAAAIVLSGILLISLPAVSVWAESKFQLTNNVLRLVVLSAALNLFLQYILDVIRLHFTPIKFAIIAFAKVLVAFAITFYCIKILKLGISSFFIGESLACLICLPIAIYFIRQDLACVFEIEIIVKLFNFGFPFVFVGLAYWVFGSIDRWMLADLASISEVGLYSVAFRFASILLFINSSFAQAWSPHVLQLRMSNPKYTDEIVKVALPWFFLLLFFATAIAIFSDELLRFLVPEPYWKASSSLVFLVFGVALHGTTQITVIGISIAERSKLLVWVAWFTAMVNTGLNYVLIPKYGSLGASLATFICYGILTFIYAFWSQNFLPLAWPKGGLILMGLFSILCLSCCMAFTIIDWQPAVVPIKIALMLFIIWLAFRFNFLKYQLISEVIGWKSPAKNA